MIELPILLKCFAVVFIVRMKDLIRIILIMYAIYLI